MKRRGDEIQTFHNPAARVGGTPANHRITTSPQNSINSLNANPSQFHLINVVENKPGSMATNIQYTYMNSSAAIPNAARTTNNNVTQVQLNQVHVVNASSLPNATVRQKPATTSGTITPTPNSVTSPGGGTGTAPQANAQNVSGQNFPRLKVEDALSYLDQVNWKHANYYSSCHFNLNIFCR
jgi:histone deacetylase complex regulatory component SIN3